MELPKKYDAKEAEKRWKEYWEKEQIFKFDINSKKEIYSIDTPPPYASAGHLHVGHGLSYTQFEIVARVMRLLGKNVYFPPGFDDNGLPTEKYVEEKLGINKSKINRAEFRKLCLEESEKVEKTYSENVFKRLGHSYDWDLLYTTISPEAQKVTQTVFLKLAKQKDCYRKEEPVIWCPKHETALAQAEVEDLTRTTKLNYIDFDIANSKDKATIATTRPEFLAACTGIFVNPEDKRYKKLIGKELVVPIFNHKVKIMADEKVDKEFGTGIVMICTFGDTSDIEWWKKHKLELKNLLNLNGTLNELAGKYSGMNIKKARENILDDLEKEGRLKKQEPLKQTVGSCWRCNTPVEYIVTKQWFIKTLDYKKDLVKRGREVKWYPDFMRVRFENWVENLGWDWIISRQRYYGVPIPAWYCDDCDEIILASENELPLDPMEIEKKCPKCGKKARADTDVFDTWMSSSNTPEIASRWLEKPEEYKKIAPMSLRPQSHDIIRTWTFYTILKSHLLFKRIPWKDLIINTFVLDPKGKGMSKSKGNAVWVDDLIEKYGVDAFRYWVGSASIGNDIPFKEQELIAGEKFLIKLWNASKFVFMHLKDHELKKPKKFEKLDKWMLQKISTLSKEVKVLYENYNISEARKKAETFFWHTFCDNYLEIVKDRLYNPDSRGKEARVSAQYVLYTSLLSILKMMAPIMPFITEEIYQDFFKKIEQDKSIHISKWPVCTDTLIDEKAEEVGDVLVKVISAVRKVKSENNKSLKESVKVLIIDCKKELHAGIEDAMGDLKAVTKAETIEFGKGDIELDKELKVKIGL